MQGKRRLSCSGKIEKNEMCMNGIFFVLFLRKRPLHFLCSLLFVHVGKRSNTSFGYKIDIFHISLCHCFAFLHNSIRISIPWLFRTCFHTKSFSKCYFRTHYNVGSSTLLIESPKFRNNSRITVASSSNLL